MTFCNCTTSFNGDVHCDYGKLVKPLLFVYQEEKNKSPCWRKPHHSLKATGRHSQWSLWGPQGDKKEEEKPSGMHLLLSGTFIMCLSTMIFLRSDELVQLAEKGWACPHSLYPSLLACIGMLSSLVQSCAEGYKVNRVVKHTGCWMVTVSPNVPLLDWHCIPWTPHPMQPWLSILLGSCWLSLS